MRKALTMANVIGLIVGILLLGYLLLSVLRPEKF
ncbi:MAG: K(+)-transporting ATPase subunit F [Candidatus Aminicenantales bacterium]